MPSRGCIHTVFVGPEGEVEWTIRNEDMRRDQIRTQVGDVGVVFRNLTILNVYYVMLFWNGMEQINC